jgi:hypothetical protein
MDDQERSRLDALLDLLADEVATRLAVRSDRVRMEREPAQISLPVVETVPEVERATEPPPMPDLENEAEVTLETVHVPEEAAPSHAAALMIRLALGVVALVVLINIPLNAQGTALARSIPSSASLVIRNGLVVKESTSPEIWVYRDGAFHWITSLDVFTHLGYQWRDVHIVEPGFVNQFPKGKPLYLVWKCDSSPHIYRLEDGYKRWIIDIPTFVAEGYVWNDVEIVPCQKLHALPDGDSIPPGHGSPPPPLP